jgi:hypothetical protein
MIYFAVGFSFFGCTNIGVTVTDGTSLEKAIIGSSLIFIEEILGSDLYT